MLNNRISKGLPWIEHILSDVFVIKKKNRYNDIINVSFSDIAPIIGGYFACNNNFIKHCCNKKYCEHNAMQLQILGK